MKMPSKQSEYSQNQEREVLRVESLCAGYGAREVLRNVSFQVAAGEILAVVGPNGCGKSTLLRCIAGLLPPSRGRVLASGDDIASLSPRERARRIALLPQSLAAMENDGGTVQEVVALGRTPFLPPYGTLSKRDHEIVANALQAVDAADFASRPIEELSGGERQRVALARALAQEPKLLLLDEPASNLDIRYAHETLDLVSRLARQGGLAVVLVLHQINLAAAIADTMLLMENGAMRALGTPAKVMTEDNLRAVYQTPLSVSLHPKSGRPQARSDWEFSEG